MKIEKLTDFDLAEEFLQNNFSSPTHWPEWNLLISQLYGSKFYYLAAYQKNSLMGLCPIHEEKKGILKNLFSGQYYYIPNGGWIFNEKKSLTTFHKVSFFSSFQIFSLPEINEFGVLYNIKSKSFFTLIIDLRKDLNSIWTQDVNSKRRNMIRKAEKNNISIKMMPEENIDDFYNHYLSFNTSHKLKSLPFDFFSKSKSFQKIKIDYFVALTNNTVSHYLLTVRDKNYSFYWAGINISGFENLGQSELLQWQAIQFLKEQKCSYYDLCYIEKERLPKIYEFKKGFSQTEVPITFFNSSGIGFKLYSKFLKWF